MGIEERSLGAKWIASVYDGGAAAELLPPACAEDDMAEVQNRNSMFEVDFAIL